MKRCSDKVQNVAARQRVPMERKAEKDANVGFEGRM